MLTIVINSSSNPHLLLTVLGIRTLVMVCFDARLLTLLSWLLLGAPYDSLVMQRSHSLSDPCVQHLLWSCSNYILVVLATNCLGFHSYSVSRLVQVSHLLLVLSTMVKVCKSIRSPIPVFITSCGFCFTSPPSLCTGTSQSCDKSCSRFCAKFMVTETSMHHRWSDDNNLLAVDYLETFRVD